MWMKSTPLACQLLGDRCTTWTTGPHVRDWQYSGVAKVTTNGCFAASAAADRRAQQLRSGGSAVVTVFGRTPGFSVGLPGGDRPVAERGRSGLLLDDEVAERLDLLAADRFREDPVRPRLRRAHRGHVDVLRVGLHPAGDADRLEPAVVSAYGFCFSPRAIQTRAVGRRSAATARR